ncbi:MAG TPA: TIGR03085 family metal-binding protein, partial [Pilimelia sp.]|nr:TIGR03085 family metal-binding protein [Pilimelia sp.]
MTRYAQAERRALADLLAAVGPDAPTLCEGWTARDLAAHLVVRERRPDAAAGLVLPPLRGWGDKVRAEQALTPYAEIVDRVRHPPRWSPVSNPLTDEVANGLEFFIHHEDVRRAVPGWQPRRLPAEQEAVLWRRAKGVARLALRRFRGAVLVQAPG